MKINSRIKQILALVFILLVINLLLLSIFILIERNFFNKTANLIGGLIETEEKSQMQKENNKKELNTMEERIFKIIKKEDANYTKKGKEAFLKYGYSKIGIIFDFNKKILFMLCISFSAFIFAFLFILFFLFKQKQNRNIEHSIALIKNIKKQNYKIDLVKDDSNFSSLNDEIYKALILFNETWQQAITEKQNFKENLENISHQLKIPISSMNIMLELFEDEYGDEYPEISNKTFIKIKSQLARLQNLTETLLTVSKLDAGNIEMKQDNFLLEECLSYSLEAIEEELNAKNIFPQIEIPHLKIKGDFYWIAEAFLNILKNFSDLYPHLTKIRITGKKNSVYTEVCFENDGGKIPKEDLPKIFNRFYKTSESKGFGIGLSMTKAILEKNNADISVENTEMGVIFIIKFF